MTSHAMADEKDALKRHHHSSHPLAVEEWFALFLLQKLAQAGQAQALYKLALVNKNLFAAFNSDLLWQKLLPPASHLDFLFNECDDTHLLHCYRNHSLSKRALFQRLCQPIPLAGGLKKFWLDRATGGECYMISASALDIAKDSESQNWKWLPCHCAWFPVVAFLKYIEWFEINGKFQQLLRPGSYTVSFRMQIRSSSSWRCWPVRLSLQNLTYRHDVVKLGVLFHSPFPISDPPLISPPPPQEGQPTADDANHSDSKHYEWIECDVGEFIVEENEDSSPIEVEFSMREVEFLDTRHGILLDGVLIRPTSVVSARQGATICVGSMYEINDAEGKQQ